MITNSQQIEDIVDFINYIYNYTTDQEKIEASQVAYITEEGRDLGFCETCSMWEDGIQLHFKDNRPNDLYWFDGIEMDMLLDWIHDGKPEGIVYVPEEHRHYIIDSIETYGMEPIWPRNSDNKHDHFFDVDESDINWDDIFIEVDACDKSVEVFFAVMKGSRFAYDNDATDQELQFRIDESRIKELYSTFRALNWFRD